MFAARQMVYNSQGAQAYGNANITGSGTGSTPATVFANTVSTSTYLTYQVPYKPATADAYVSVPKYPQTYGNLTVTGNTAVLDILVVGAGGYTTVASRQGGDGGQVLFYSNVIVPVGTYTLSVSGNDGQIDIGPSLGYSNITIGTTNLIAYNGNPGSATTGVATGGNGANGSHIGGVGGAGRNVVQFGTDLTWIVSNGNPYFGGGGGGADGSADNVYYAGGITSGYTLSGTLGIGSGGIYAEGYSPEGYTYQEGLANFGAGAGGGYSGSNWETYYSTYPGSSGVIIIRHIAS